MLTPELIVSVAGFAITFGTLLYKFGRLEGTLTSRLDEHERRLNVLDAPPPQFHGQVQRH